MQRWYEREKPVVEQAGRIRVQWFPRAGRLQFVTARTDPVTGQDRSGLTLTVGVDDFAGAPGAIALVEEFVTRSKESAPWGKPKTDQG